MLGLSIFYVFLNCDIVFWIVYVFGYMEFRIFFKKNKVYKYLKFDILIKM